MTFSLMRPPSPHPDGPISVQGNEDDSLSSVLHAALSTLVPGSSAHPDNHHDMSKEKERAGIDIVVDSDCLFLRGTGTDVEPVLLKGQVVLRLTEPTSIKGITLQFRGKAKLPLPSSDAMPLTTSPQWFTLCNHQWSFLEGEKRTSHTLKAGSHRFPFQLQLGGSLPSSMASSMFGGAHISYKLRAVAVRPGFATNMQAVMPISIIRSFAPEALEYQQSLEIENSWPEKLMYSIMIPHKAWAAGDQLTAVVKFSPLSKGVRVLSVTTTVYETTKMHCRGGVQDNTCAIITVNHEIPNGSAEQDVGSDGLPLTPASLPASFRLSTEDRSQSSMSLVALANQDLTLQQVSSNASLTESHSMPAPPPPLLDPSASSAEPIASTSASAAEEEVPMSRDDIVAHLTAFIPKFVTPTHTLEPITVSHRIRWSILMSNLDGHTSELRCSLPLHILDSRLLDEARANSAATRRLLLGGPEVPVGEEHDAELPSYSAHVRDRVANMYLPDSATTRVLNPWVHNRVSPTFTPDHNAIPGAWPHSGSGSPLMPHPVSSHLPHVPQSGTSTPLDWVNSELLLSLSDHAVTRPRSNTNASYRSQSPSNPASRDDSGPVSRRASRAPSPERQFTMTAGPAASETFIHDGHASRTLPGLFSIRMKAHPSLTSPGWLSSRSGSHSSVASLGDVRTPMPGHYTAARTAGGGGGGGGGVPVSVAGSQTSTPTPGTGSVPTLWHRAFTEVPDYGVASRGFIGGVTPLTSMRGLPSYEEAERSANVEADGEDEQLTMRVRRNGVGRGRAA